MITFTNVKVTLHAGMLDVMFIHSAGYQACSTVIGAQIEKGRDLGRAN